MRHSCVVHRIAPPASERHASRTYPRRHPAVLALAGPRGPLPLHVQPCDERRLVRGALSLLPCEEESFANRVPKQGGRSHATQWPPPERPHGLDTNNRPPRAHAPATLNSPAHPEPVEGRAGQPRKSTTTSPRVRLWRPAGNPPLAAPRHFLAHSEPVEGRAGQSRLLQPRNPRPIAPDPFRPQRRRFHPRCPHILLQCCHF